MASTNPTLQRCALVGDPAEFELMKKTACSATTTRACACRTTCCTTTGGGDPRCPAILAGSQPHLLGQLQPPGVRPAAVAKVPAAVRKRFGQWILDTAQANYDQRWLDHQHQIGLRHHRTAKNRTDGAEASPIVPFRDLFALIFPVTVTPALPREEGPLGRAGRADARGVAQVRPAAADAVEPSLRQGRGLLMPPPAPAWHTTAWLNSSRWTWSSCAATWRCCMRSRCCARPASRTACRRCSASPRCSPAGH